MRGSGVDPHLQAMVRRARFIARLANWLATLTTTTAVVVPLILFHAPTWAWLGFGLVNYLGTIRPVR